VVFGRHIDRDAGHVHPLRYCLALAREAEAAGAVIYENAPVTQAMPGRLSTHKAPWRPTK
jgi:gamma-glutamylputrescine oxidase